jgi:hypothetical protein
MSVPFTLANVDWPTVVAGLGTFIGALYLSVRGVQKGREKVESGKSEITSIVGASLIESTSVQLLSLQLQENTAAVRENTAEMKRCNDINLLTHRN